MQLDREGVEDTQATSVNLEKHFRSHGLSATGYSKIAADVANGDMTVDILVEFPENELINLADEYDLSTLQKKAFVKAVKLLPNSKANTPYLDNNNSTSLSGRSIIQDVYITQQERNTLADIKKLESAMNEYLEKCTNIQNGNKKKIVENIEHLQKCSNIMKQAIDNAINTLIKKVWFHNRNVNFVLIFDFYFIRDDIFAFFCSF